jgi:hypothetical protein
LNYDEPFDASLSKWFYILINNWLLRAGRKRNSGPAMGLRGGRIIALDFLVTFLSKPAPIFFGEKSDKNKKRII